MKISHKFFSAIIISVLGLSVSLPTASAWDDCPFGFVDDPYPGECSRYIDTDGDGICDHSQPAPENRIDTSTSYTDPQLIGLSEPTELTETTNIETSSEEHEYDFSLSGKELKALTVSQLAEFWGGIPVECLLNHLKLESGANEINASTPIQYLHDEYDMEPSEIKAIAQSVYNEKKAESPVTVGTSSTPTTQSEDSMTSLIDKVNDSYHTIFLALLGAILFLLGKILVWTGKAKQSTERKFWNILLLFAFVGSASTGMLLSLRRDSEILFTLPKNFLWLHAETSLTMAFISVYHIIWHWKYYWCLIKKKNKKDASCEIN